MTQQRAQQQGHEVARLGGSAITRRKGAHLQASLEQSSQYQTVRNGFETVQLPYNALPDLALQDVDLSTTFLGMPISAPILIGSMTGGSEQSRVINMNLALAARELQLPFAVGSQRIMLEQPLAHDSFAVRKYLGSSLPLLGNLGVTSLVRHPRWAELALDAIGADAIFIHCNPLQEGAQTGGDHDFRRGRETIARCAQDNPSKILVKEVGHGLSHEVLDFLATTDIVGVDVAGAGGTTWNGVEQMVTLGRIADPSLAEWGIPTAHALRDARDLFLRPRTVIAGGGIRTAMDIAKAGALGADLVSVARPLLEAALASPECVIRLLQQLVESLRVIIWCTGCSSYRQLSTMGTR